MDKESLARELRQEAAKVGGYEAEYREVVKGAKGVVKFGPTPPRSVSWGDRDGERTVVNARRESQIVWQSPNPMGVETGIGLPERSVLEKDRWVSEVRVDKDHPQAIVSAPSGRRGGWLAAESGREFGGIPIAEVVETASNLRLTSLGGEVILDGSIPAGQFRITLVRDHETWRIGLAAGYSQGRLREKIETRAYRLAPDGTGVPSRAVRELYDGSGAWQGTTTATLTKLSKPSAETFEIEWPEGTRVSDERDGKNYIMSGGKLVIDEQFTPRPAPFQLAPWTWVTLGGVLLLGVALVLKQRTRSV